MHEARVFHALIRGKFVDGAFHENLSLNNDSNREASPLGGNPSMSR